jgi:hypothetical protein
VGRREKEVWSIEFAEHASLFKGALERKKYGDFTAVMLAKKMEI